VTVEPDVLLRSDMNRPLPAGPADGLREAL
jgi:hypothetical protein